MKNTSYYLLVAASMTVVPAAALAVESVPLPGARQEIHQEMRKDTQQMRVEMQGKAQEMRKDAQQMKTEMQTKAQEMRAEMHKEMEAMKIKRAAVQAEIKRARDDFKAKVEQRKADLKKKLGEERARRIEQYFGQMMEKFEHAIDRLKKVADRIDERLNASTADPAAVEPLRAKLVAARVRIDEAQTALTAAKAKYADAVKNADFKTAFQNVRGLVTDVAAMVRKAHRALVEVLAAIKEVNTRGRARGATTTPAQ